MSTIWLFLLLSLGINLLLISIVLIRYFKSSEGNGNGLENGFVSKELLALQLQWKKLVHNSTYSGSDVNHSRIKQEELPTLSIMTARDRRTKPPKLKEPQHPHPFHHSRTTKRHHHMNCSISYEPSCDMYSYVRFWNQRFYPNDCFQSPLRSPPSTPLTQQKFVVFQPDGAGWNNIRMAAEVAIIFAHITGRVLVLPPAMHFFLLDKNNDHTENLSTLDTFFDFKKISEAVTIITMKEFLAAIAAKGLLKKPLPPKETPDTLARVVQRQELWQYLEQACYVEHWCPGKQFIGFHFYRNQTNPQQVVFGSFHRQSQRFHEMIAHGRKLRPYDEKLHQEIAIYFPGDYRESHRILSHYYTYLYWESEHLARIYKRIVRDRLHYHDVIFCYAGKVVRLLHQESSHRDFKPLPRIEHAEQKTLGGNSHQDATYYAFHIRRGDFLFQYKDTQISGEEIWNNTRHLLDRSISSVIYISTDEKDRSFFKPFFDSGFQIKFLSDYLPVLHREQIHFPDSSEGHLRHRSHSMKLNLNHLGMIEQVICANAHSFIGTPYSTFTGYITRMRGYYRDGRYARTYYTMKQFMHQLHTQKKIKGPFWAREFEIAHRNADDYF